MSYRNALCLKIQLPILHFFPPADVLEISSDLDPESEEADQGLGAGHQNGQLVTHCDLQLEAIAAVRI